MSNPIVTIEMEQGGIIRAELYPDVAPNTVRNFISLIQKGFYNCIRASVRQPREPCRPHCLRTWRSS